MADSKLIIAELRQPLQRSGVVLGLVLALMTAAGMYNSHIGQQRQTTQQSFQGTVQEYRSALDAEQIMRTETERFSQLHARGFVGPEPRLRWIEDVRQTAAAAGVVTIRYELEPRAAYSSSISTGSFQLFASLMRLELELLHEGDLLNFLESLDQRDSGLFELISCSLRRAHSDSNEINLHTGNVSAKCELRWFSLDSADAVPVEELQ